MILLLGGTAEARSLASLLKEQGIPAISSLAGRVKDPKRPDGDVRIGGFGGPEGLASYIEEHGITTVVDATHPFADQMTANAQAACGTTKTPLLILNRPQWHPVEGDDWRNATGFEEAAALIGELPEETRVLLTTGRQDAAAFAALPQHFTLRAVDPPDPPLPERCEIILARGPFTLDDERELLEGFDVLVTKNSGGPLTAAKLRAARERGIPVVMIQRPALPAGVPVVTTPEEALQALG